MWLVAGSVPGTLMYLGLLDAIASYARIGFYVCLGFSIFSFLLSLFEEVDEPVAPLPAPQPREVKTRDELRPVAPAWALRRQLRHS